MSSRDLQFPDTLAQILPMMQTMHNIYKILIDLTGESVYNIQALKIEAGTGRAACPQGGTYLCRDLHFQEIFITAKVPLRH